MSSVKRIASITASIIVAVLMALSAFAITAGTAGAATGEKLDVNTVRNSYSLPGGVVITTESIQGIPGVIAATAEATAPGVGSADAVIIGGTSLGSAAAVGIYDTAGNGGHCFITAGGGWPIASCTSNPHLDEKTAK